MNARRSCVGAVCAVALAVALAPGAAAPAYELTAQCTAGGETHECSGRWYTAPVSVEWDASPVPVKRTSPCLLAPGYRYQYGSDIVTTLACVAEWEFESTVREAKFTSPLRVEVSSPDASVTPDRPPDSNGWYDHPVGVTFSAGGYSGPAPCVAGGSSAKATYAGPDALSATVGATCTDPAGKAVYPSFGLRYDATPPSVTGAAPSRPPDYGGWYNHPVTVVFSGTDGTSGIEGCSSVTYSGPDSASALVSGNCRDRAGNVAALALPIRYQATPPPLDASAYAGDGVVVLHWRSDVPVQIVRTPGLHGQRPSVLYRGGAGTFTDVRARNHIRYQYAVAAQDAAGISTLRTIPVTPGPRLLSPAVNAQVAAPPLLQWTPVRGASYYNVQLYRGRKVLTQWPLHASLQVRSSWRFRRRHYRLKPGRYRWYVWPGYGSLAAARYGPRIGAGTFVVVAPG